VQRQGSEEERAQLETILAGMGDGVLVVDLEGRVLLTNQAYEGTFGDNKGIELLDETGAHPLGTEETPQALAANGSSFNMTFSFRLEDGSSRWWEAVGQPVYRDGKPALGVVVLRDITERSLRRLQEEFLSMVGHELRTPLTIIKGHIQQVESWLEKPLDKLNKIERGIKLAMVQVEQLGTLIADLIDLNRLQSGKFRLEFNEVRLDELLKQVVETSQTLITRQVIEFDSDNKPVLIRGDTIRLQQVFFNLLNNALTHAPQSPRIVIRLRRMGPTNQVEICVQDYGPGIEAAYLTEVFSRFYQIEHNIEAGTRGLGLGLYICKQIVVAHNGTIRVESTRGEGATFIVQLPVSEGVSNPELDPDQIALTQV
jgi:two-component system CheB/CheR fusion protein